MFKIRGADGLVVSGGIRLWTGDVGLTIFNDTDDPAKEAAAAQDLRPLNQPSTGVTLPAVNKDCSNYSYGPPLLTGITAKPTQELLGGTPTPTPVVSSATPTPIQIATDTATATLPAQ